ncbi:MAG: hypothetical protein FJY75_07130 [Candidatus Eisenbacteria bacterium]|uniref:Gingipain domain-containing protein n=1 Tax=Eiseniibacteriota bacterium TaxID=2212470 RepID=A0A938BM27_UNCEI|nr:hypothetical protein [Candidatus Eisenbacteria bacterium]
MSRARRRAASAAGGGAARRSRGPRRRFGLPLAAAAGALAALCAPAGAAPATALSQSATGVVFELSPAPASVAARVEQGREYLEIVVPGADRRRDPGAPDLSVAEVLVALPPGARAQARIESVRWEPLAIGRPLPVPAALWGPAEGAAEVSGTGASDRGTALPGLSLDYREDAAIYAGPAPYPRQLVEVGRSYDWRHYRVVPLTVALVRYDPAAGELQRAASVRVRVDFVPDAAPPSPGVQSYLHEEPGWEAIFRGEIVNYESARGMRTWRPLPDRPLPRAPQETLELRLEIPRTGLYRVDFAELRAAGLAVPHLAWDSLRLVVRDFDDLDEVAPFREWPVAYQALDLDGDGLFEEGESLFFQGQDAWDFFGLTAGDRRYGRANVYWLVHGAGPAVTMETRPGWHDWTGLVPLLSYTRTMRFEENTYYMWILARDDVNSPSAGPQGIRTDHYNWTYPVPSEPSGLVRPIKVVPLDLPPLFRVSQVCVHLQGQGYVGNSTTAPHRPRLWLSRSEAPGDTTWAFPGNPYVVPAVDDALACGDTGSLPNSTFGAGRNYVKIYLPRRGDGIDNVDGFGIGIDWVEATFDGRFEVQEQRLLAPLDGHEGRRQLLVRNLSSQAVQVFDVGDPRAPVALAVDPAQIVGNASRQSYDLRLQVECPAAPGRCEILVVEGGRFERVPARGIRLRSAPPLAEFAGEDYVAVYYERFAAELDRLLDHRESQGHRVLRAPVGNVFDTYSGGRRHPYAIKRLLRHMWRTSAPAPEYLLLFGDASNDLAGYTVDRSAANSDTNFVTTITIPGHAISATGTELVTCDHWFADNLRGAWNEPLSFAPDLHVGRVPCGSPAEARVFVDKVLAYERGDETAPWRRRLLFVADDDFSSEISSLGSGGVYRRRGGEWRFLSITRNSANLALNDPLFSILTVDSLYLNAVMDSVPGLGRCQPDTLDPQACLRDAQGRIVPVDYSVTLNYSLNSQYGSTVVRDLLIDKLNRGALFYAYQGHSNRYLLAHEFIQQYYAPASKDDIRLLTNVGRPFVFLGFGCHLAEFATHNEADPGRGDAMVEAMLFCCEGQGRAGIAVIASTDYELIGHTYEEKFFQALLPDPPADAHGRRRWRLGEVFSHSKGKLPSTLPERLTYSLLGDPALRIGTAPPAVALTLNGDPWDSSTGGEYASSRSDDSLIVQIELKDESALGPLTVSDYFGAVPPELLVPVPIDDRHGRRSLIRYATQVQRRPYALRVQARDYDGARREVLVSMPFAAALYEQEGGELEPLPDGEIIRSTAQLALTVRCAALIESEDVRLLADGLPVPLARAEVDQAPGRPAVWTLRFGDLPSAAEPSVLLEVQAAQHGGGWLTLLSQTQPVGVVPLRVEDLAWIPNPFAEQSTLTYRLTAGAGRARLRLFTSSGREILALPHMPASKGRRHFVWDGRDADGDPVANGLYFFEFTLWDEGGRQVERRLDKLVRVR